MIVSETRGVFVCEVIEAKYHILFADDIYSVVDLRRQADVLRSFCDKWGLKVNMEGSKLNVFRNDRC